MNSVRIQKILELKTEGAPLPMCNVPVPKTAVHLRFFGSKCY